MKTTTTTTTTTEDYVFSDRGGIVENRHGVHAAVVDVHGKILYTVGDPTRMTLHRSAAKPVQALAVLEAISCDPEVERRLDFDDADVALMCASHNSEERHVARARRMLVKVGVGVGEDVLRCGGHPALSSAVNRAWIKRDYIPTAVCNNCSGKHVGMLAGSLALGGPDAVADYHCPTHPMQLKVRRVVEDLSGLSDAEAREAIRWGIDGCNLPAPASPLYILARSFVFFADAADQVENKRDIQQEITPEASEPQLLPSICSLRTQVASRIFYAMATYPDLVAGQGRFCTDLMTSYEGILIGKVGADGCYGIGVRASGHKSGMLGHPNRNDSTLVEDNNNTTQGSIGIAVKIEDGNIDILYAAVVEILEQLQIGSPAMRRRLAAFHRPDIINTAGVVTGHVSHSFKVRPFELSGV